MQDIGEISRQLSGRAEEIARHLLPNGKREGSEWRVGGVDGGSGKSLAVHLNGDKAGLWKDFASDEGGDLLDLWAAVTGENISYALREAKSYLGVVEPAFVGARKKEYRKPEKPKCRTPKPESEVMQYLTEARKLTAATIAAFQLAEGADSNGPFIVFPYLRNGELVNIKYLNLIRDENGKKISRLEGKCMMALFGWQTIEGKAREIVISEGEIDAMTWHQMGFACLSVPNGAKSFTWLENEFEFLERFETIYLSWDMDGDGRKGVNEAIDRLGRHRCRVVELPYKDANECLQNGMDANGFRVCLESSASCDPAELKRASVYVEEVIEEFYPSSGKEAGFTSPWTKLHGQLQFRPGELTIWSGSNFTGKTTMLSQVILSAMEQGEKACIASLEVKPKKLLKKMTRQATGEKLPLVETIRDAHLWYDGRLWMFDLVGGAKAERLFEVFEYARRRYGITNFVIDALMRCGIDEDDWNGQKQFADRFAEFATSHDVHSHLVAHSRKGENDNSENNRFDVKGSGSITDLAHKVIIVWRNRAKEKMIEDAASVGMNVTPQVREQPDAMLICDKDRDGEWTGRAGLWFDAQSHQYLESSDSRSRVYVPDVMEELA